jgi:hypothetical protein
MAAFGTNVPLFPAPSQGTPLNHDLSDTSQQDLEIGPLTINVKMPTSGPALAIAN